MGKKGLQNKKREGGKKWQMYFRNQISSDSKISVTPTLQWFAGLIGTKLFLHPKPNTEVTETHHANSVAAFRSRISWNVNVPFVLCNLYNESIICLVKDPVKYVIRLSHNLSLSIVKLYHLFHSLIIVFHFLCQIWIRKQGLKTYKFNNLPWTSWAVVTLHVLPLSA